MSFFAKGARWSRYMVNGCLCAHHQVKREDTHTTTQYYCIGGVSVGMKKVENQIPTLSYFLTDHLGSVVGTVSENGALISETRYSSFGEIRTDVGTISATDYGFTFQKVVTGSGLTLCEGAWTIKPACTTLSPAGSSSQIRLCPSRGAHRGTTGILMQVTTPLIIRILVGILQSPS